MRRWIIAISSSGRRLDAPDAAALASEMPLLWPEVGAPHRVLKVYVFGNDKPNLWVDVTETIEPLLNQIIDAATDLIGSEAVATSLADANECKLCFAAASAIADPNEVLPGVASLPNSHCGGRKTVIR